MRKFILIISAVLLVLAVALIITSMIFNAVEGMESVLSTAFAIASAVSAFIGFILILVGFKGKGEIVESSK